MALNPTQQNIITRMQDMAERVIVAKRYLGEITAIYNAENLNTLTDAELAAIPEFAHITGAELNAARAAMVELNTALGEYATGTVVQRMIRIVRSLP